MSGVQDKLDSVQSMSTKHSVDIDQIQRHINTLTKVDPAQTTEEDKMSNKIKRL